MLEKYIIAIKKSTKEVILIEHRKFNAFYYEPIDGSDSISEARKMLAAIKKLGISGYLDKVIIETSEGGNEE